MSKTMIITDTCSDIPVEMVDKYDVEILATDFLINGKHFSEGIDFAHENFYEILPAESGTVKNFSIPAAVYLDRYKNAATCGFDGVIVICAGSTEFPMYNSAKEAATLFAEQNPTSDLKINVIATQNYSMTAGLLVIEAAKKADEGEDFNSLVEYIEKTKDEMKMIVDAFYVPKSINDFSKPWHKWLTLKNYHPFPTLSVTTSGASELPIIKGDHSAFDQYYAYCVEVLREKKPDYAIGYASRVKEARALSILLEEELGYPPVALYKLGAISSYGASKAAIALCYKDAE
ncbi:MAG: DegV family protein [Oscillospiraceae bacterium]|nr:DegV family protein [Oscillospiraceae bacterium]